MTFFSSLNADEPDEMISAGESDEVNEPEEAMPEKPAMSAEAMPEMAMPDGLVSHPACHSKSPW